MTPRGDSDVPERTRARLTPYELAFGYPLFEDDLFPRIRDEAEARGVRTAAPEQFLMLGAVGNALRDHLPEAEPRGAAPLAEAGGGPAAEAAHGRVLDEFGRLFFQAYHFWLYGKRLLVAEPAVVRALVDGAPRVGEWSFTPPHPAGYVQLPRHLFWIEPSPGAPPEPVDGFFWTAVGEVDPAEPPFRRLDLVLAAGLRPGRPGFSTVAAGAELVGAQAGHWADADARPDGRDFASVLPGGELDRLYSITNVLEALKLVSLLFWYVAAHPGALVAGEGAGGATGGGATGEASAGVPGGATSGAAERRPATPHALPPSELAYERIVPPGRR